MPTRGGKFYLLGESSEMDKSEADPTLSKALADIMEQLTALRHDLNAHRTETTEKLAEIEATQLAAEHADVRPPLQQYQRRAGRHNPDAANRNDGDPDDRYIKSIKVDAPTFDGSLDPQSFLEWFQQMDRYFTWFQLSEERKVKFAAMKLTGQAGQYWSNVEIMRRERLQQPIMTWIAMKDELKGKYVPPSYHSRLLDQWHQLSQGGQSAKDYVVKFDEFLTRCSALGSESNAQILSRFRSGLRPDLRNELLARGVTELEKAYALIEDLDQVRGIFVPRNLAYKNSTPKPATSQMLTRSTLAPYTQSTSDQGKGIVQA